MKLYELSREYQTVEAMLDDPEIDVQAVLDTLQGIAGEFEEKADNTACMVKQLEAGARAMKTEADALTKRAKAMGARADRLREYLYREMSLAGFKKIETARNLLQVKKTPASVRIENEEAFLRWATDSHPEYLRSRDPEVDKTAVRDALKSGAELPGVKLESGETFSIK